MGVEHDKLWVTEVRSEDVGIARARVGWVRKEVAVVVSFTLVAYPVPLDGNIRSQKVCVLNTSQAY